MSVSGESVQWEVMFFCSNVFIWITLRGLRRWKYPVQTGNVQRLNKCQCAVCVPLEGAQVYLVTPRNRCVLTRRSQKSWSSPRCCGSLERMCWPKNTKTMTGNNVSCRVCCWQRGVCALTHHTSSPGRTPTWCQSSRVLKRLERNNKHDPTHTPTLSAVPPAPQKPTSLGVRPSHDSSSSSVICDWWRTLLPGAQWNLLQRSQLHLDHHHLILCSGIIFTHQPGLSAPVDPLTPALFTLVPSPMAQTGQPHAMLI